MPSPGSPCAVDDYSANPRYIELQEELRCVLFTGFSSCGPGETATSRPSDADSGGPDDYRPRQVLDLCLVSIPKARLLGYLRNWIVECSPYLDKFDDGRHFGIHVPLLAETSPPLLHAMLAFSARQMDLCKASPDASCDSLELYQESIRQLAPSLRAKDPNTLVTACILAVFELMSGSSRDWRLHIDGCSSLFDFFAINGFSGGLLQAVFWCYARMELCGAIVSGGTASTVLPLDRWIPPLPGGMAAADGDGDAADDHSRRLFYQSGRDAPGMHANWAVYLCARACDLMYRRTRHLELGEPDGRDHRPFARQWNRLWDDMQFWLKMRPQAMLPLDLDEDGGGGGGQHVFPTILFAHWAAISANQLYHAASILMLEMRPPEASLPSPQSSALWHARRVCGISWTNPHRGNLINAIQPLYLAGRLLTHLSEHLEVARLFKLTHQTTGWGALWRLRDLEAEWGYAPGEILAVI